MNRYLIIISFMLFAKNSNAQQKVDSLTTKLTKEQVIIYIKKNYIRKNKPLGNAKVNTVIENMEFGKMNLERAGQDVIVLIIPLKKIYFSQFIDTTKQKPLQYVLIYERITGISSASFMLIYPTDKSLTEMRKGAFHDYHSQEEPQVDGLYTLLNFWDDKVCELYIEKGRRKKFRAWRYRNNFKTKDINECIDWYLYTDNLNDDGTSKSEEKDLGKSCTECPPGFKCDPIKK